MLMVAAALLRDNPRPTEDDINSTMTNLCRCGTYPRVKRANHCGGGKITGRPTKYDFVIPGSHFADFCDGFCSGIADLTRGWGIPQLDDCKYFNDHTFQLDHPR